VIVMDPPRLAMFRGRLVTTAHMLSTLPGKAGTDELLAFAKALGMKAQWIQHRGEPREHFDLLGVKRCEAARLAGAVVNRHLLACALIDKRTTAERPSEGGPDAALNSAPGASSPSAPGSCASRCTPRCSGCSP